MMTFTYRDHRRTLLADAIAAATARVDELEAALDALPPGDPARGVLAQQIADLQALGALLGGERTELALDRWEACDEHARAVASDWVFITPGLLAGVIADPALTAVERAPLLTPAGAATVDAIGRIDGEPRRQFLAQVEAAIGDAAALDELVGVALGFWIRQPLDDRASPFRDVGVLLPLRLETLFDEQPDATWVLSLRVVPDEPSIRRDQPNVTASEVGALDAFWERSRVMAPAAGATPAEWLEHPEGIVAFEQLSDRVTAPRAAWLLAAFPGQVEDGRFSAEIPPERVSDPMPDRVAGLPDALDVVIVDNGGQEHHIGTLEPDRAALTLPLPSSREGAFGSWLASWPRALEVGMGGEFPLPAGCTPDTIESLYVWGVGDEPAAEHFAAHADAGVMGLLRPGAATNSVHGAAAADLAGTSDSWRMVAIKRLRGQRDGSVASISALVCGDTAALPHVPGASTDLADARRMVQALGPALWGHHFRDLWQCGDEAHVLGQWAMEALHPEGPFQPLRIATQPYGLLPITALEQWRLSGDTDFDRIEQLILRAVLRIRSVWVSAGAARGTIVGADSERLLELLARTGVSARYLHRTFLPAEQLAAAYPAVPLNDFVRDAHQAWRHAVDAVRHDPARAYLAIGHGRPLRLPLIGARRMPAAPMVEIVQALYEREAIVYQEPMRGVLPDSLLVRLLIHAVHLTKAWFVQSAEGLTTPIINPLRWDDAVEMTPLDGLQGFFATAEQNGLARGPVVRLMEIQRKAVFALAEELDRYRRDTSDPLDPQVRGAELVVPPERREELERALRATLDSAGHRIDPWATGIAWRRLREHSSSFRRRYRLGAYGWLDGPFLGTPGPTRAGRLHAPSHAQALTSLILRDKFLSSDHEQTADSRNIWKMDLTSASVRLAIAMADEVRLGFHIFEVVGRRVEGVVGRPDLVRALRKAVPLRPERPDQREVCHGPNALDGLLANAIPGVLIPAEQARQLAELAELKRALEAYSDLLIAEGVHQVVTGHADIAAEVMDAAAGFSRPPAFEFVRTPPSGYRLVTSVVAVLPHQPPVDEGPPLALVDRSLAVMLAQRFSDADGWSWDAAWKETVGNAEVDRHAVVALEDLSLEPLDVVLVPEDFLVEAVRTRIGAPDASVTRPPSHRLMRQLAGALGARPATLPDVARQADLPAEMLEQSESLQRQELFDRYSRARAACAALSAEMDAAGVADPQRVAWLRKVLAWGITGPASVSARQTLLKALFSGDVPAHEDLEALTAAAQATLAARLEATPPEADPATATLPVIDLARALAELASPDGKLTVTSRWVTADLVDASSVDADVIEADLDDEWLSVMAAVRPTLSRLEALQLEARVLERFEPFRAWSSSPGDPWQTALVAQNVAARRGGGGITSLNPRRFVAAYGPAGAWNGAAVAVAVIDQFSEAIPMAERNTYAAFGFNAPAARAPQAILLAVPPETDVRLENEVVLQMLKETRLLVRARAARPDDVTAQPIAPTMWFQGAGPLRMRLDTGTQWFR